MHLYLKSIGFSKYFRRWQVLNLLDNIENENKEDTAYYKYNDEEERGELRIPVCEDIGICIVSYRYDDYLVERKHYYPYLYSDEYSSDAHCSIERHIDRDDFSGILDDNRIGISLIFRLSNVGEYLDRLYNSLSTRIKGVYLSGFSISGKILLPVKKTNKEVYIYSKERLNREELIEAAKNGDEMAIESLSRDDMDLYNRASKRLMNEDIYTIVDNLFMPAGIEGDVYTIIGNILNIELRKNYITEEEIYCFLIECNDILLKIAINKNDLEGEPSVNMRFKGNIWLQGRVEFEN